MLPATIPQLANDITVPNVVVEEKDNINFTNEINKKQLYEKGLGIGLKNIMERYKSLIGKEVIVEESDEFFTVKLPLVQE